MKEIVFIELHSGGQKRAISFPKIAEIIDNGDAGARIIYNFDISGDYAHQDVDETYIEITDKLKKMLNR